jgi:hypothetical protein
MTYEITIIQHIQKTQKVRGEAQSLAQAKRMALKKSKEHPDLFKNEEVVGHEVKERK